MPLSRKFAKIGILIFLFVIFTFMQSYCDQNFSDNDWYKYAAEYVYLDEIMMRHEIEKKNTAMQDYTNRDIVESKIHKLSILPTQNDLAKLLISNDIKEQKVALVLIRIKQMYSKKLFSEILPLMDSSDDFFVRFYIYQNFNSIGKMELSYFAEDFLKNFEKEENETLIISGLQILTVIDSKKIIPLFIKYFKTGSLGLKRSAYIYFNKLNKKYQDKIRDDLKEDNISLTPEAFFPK